MPLTVRVDQNKQAIGFEGCFKTGLTGTEYGAGRAGFSSCRASYGPSVEYRLLCLLILLSPRPDVLIRGGLSPKISGNRRAVREWVGKD